MIRIKQHIVGWMLPTLLLAACEHENVGNESPSPDRVPLVFQADIDGVDTRVLNGQWESSDAVGLTMFRRNAHAIAEGVKNYRYIMSAAAVGTFIPANEANTAYYPTSVTDYVDVFACYPYKASLFDANLLVNIDISDPDDRKNTDLLIASAVNRNINDPVTHFTFKHALTKLTFVFQAPDMQLSNLKLAVDGMYTACKMNIRTNEITGYTNKKKVAITLPSAGTSTQGDMLTLPGLRPSDLTLTFTASGGQKFVVLPTETFTFMPGKNYTFYLTYKKELELETITETGLSEWNLEEWNYSLFTNLSPLLKLETTLDLDDITLMEVIDDRGYVYRSGITYLTGFPYLENEQINLLLDIAELAFYVGGKRYVIPPTHWIFDQNTLSIHTQYRPQ